jgi:hypothetical protein
VTLNNWSRERQQFLLCQLSGFWKEDIWDMRNSPADIRVCAKQRRLRFGCNSSAINGELKYALS